MQHGILTRAQHWGHITVVRMMRHTWARPRTCKQPAGAMKRCLPGLSVSLRGWYWKEGPAALLLPLLLQ